MMRTKNALKNTITALAFDLVTIISGFILPRLILSRFGSSYNGIISSISQFIGYVGLLSAGIGGVTRASLYKPLERKDTYEISAILKATELFLRKVAVIFLLGLLVFAASYPLLVVDEFDWIFAFSLVLILGASTFVQYYFGITYQILLQADQRQFIILLVQILTTVANTIIAVLLISVGSTIHMVKLGSSIIFMLNPIIIFAYVRRKYKIIQDVNPDTSAISQRWDAFAHQIADFIHNNTDLVILSFFSNVKEISVYTVYYMISSAVKKAIVSMATGIEAAFGNMIAKDETDILNKNFKIFEFLIYSTSIIMCTSMGLLIVPFVSVYTKGITDVNYYRPEFGYLISAVQFFYCIRIPYQAVARAAGHYRQTRNGAVFEAVLNLGISLTLVKLLGLIGVAIGTLCAIIFRTVQYAIYVSKNILNRSVFVVVRRVVISIFNITGIVVVVVGLQLPQVNTYGEWCINAVIVFTVSILTTVIICLVFYLNDAKGFLQLFKGLRIR